MNKLRCFTRKHWKQLYSLYRSGEHHLLTSYQLSLCDKVKWANADLLTYALPFRSLLWIARAGVKLTAKVA